MNRQNKNQQVLTDRMDTGTKEFSEFQAILLNKAKGRTEEHKKKIELMALKFKMENYLKSEEKHPKLVGDFIMAYLSTFEIKQNKFAHYIGIRPSNFSKLIKGERSLNHEIALILGTIFQNDPMLWLDIQDKNKLYELSEIKKEEIRKYSLDDLINH